MNRSDREERVRRLMAAGPPVLPPDLAAEAVRRGARLALATRGAEGAIAHELCAGAVAFTVWALAARPWVEPPSDTTPPLTGW
ncbi:hypothetical protein [Streptomyces sp. yara]|uniref:hypothetical protein n=1 Tax=Streptomyces sp. yara TaxID=3458421 RepID=UPI00403FFEA9